MAAVAAAQAEPAPPVVPPAVPPPPPAVTEPQLRILAATPVETRQQLGDATTGANGRFVG